MKGDYEKLKGIWGQAFWARGYYVDTVGRNRKQIQEYIKRQLDEDQLSLKEFIDPFMDSKNIKA